MKPIFKQYLWGSDRLKTVYGKNIPGIPTSESWEVASHKNGSSLIDNGRFKGTTLSELCKLYPAEIMGAGFKKEDKFPLMLKLLDAKEDLSVQVHPDDEFAMKNENGELGKTEAWYVLDAEKGSKLVYGFKKDNNKQTFADALKNGTLENILNYVPVKKGDVFFIKAGTVHAIGKGVLIAEIQQNSDTTYRVYDYNRRDKDGNLRPLHIEKALAVSDTECCEGNEKIIPEMVIEDGCKLSYMIKSDKFSMTGVEIEKSFKMRSTKMTIVFFEEGNGKIVSSEGTEAFKKGDSFVIPASVSEINIVGKSKVLIFDC